MPCENTTSGTRASAATWLGQYRRTGTSRLRAPSTQSRSVTLGSILGSALASNAACVAAASAGTTVSLGASAVRDAVLSLAYDGTSVSAHRHQTTHTTPNARGPRRGICF